MVVSAARGDEDARVRFRLAGGCDRWNERGSGVAGGEERWDPEKRLGSWGGGSILPSQGRDQRHSHTFTV